MKVLPILVLLLCALGAWWLVYRSTKETRAWVSNIFKQLAVALVMGGAIVLFIYHLSASTNLSLL